jgi:hypothetical protein
MQPAQLISLHTFHFAHKTKAFSLMANELLVEPETIMSLLL